MRIEVLMLPTSSRSTGYISVKSKIARLYEMLNLNLITDYERTDTTSAVYRFTPSIPSLKEIERILRSSHIAYRKVI